MSFLDGPISNPRSDDEWHIYRSKKEAKRINIKHFMDRKIYRVSKWAQKLVILYKMKSHSSGADL